MKTKTVTPLRVQAVRLLAAVSMTTVMGCSSAGNPFRAAAQDHYLPSGTIILSLNIPATPQLAVPAEPRMAPIIGYIPPTAGFVPADNETWLEIDRTNRSIAVFRGKDRVKEVQAEGQVSLAPGVYALQHKQKKPLWYAPDDYFRKRHLAIPKSNDRLRYRRGALGNYVLFATTTFPIHSAPMWSEDVGGLRISKAELSEIFYMLPIGASIVVK